MQGVLLAERFRIGDRLGAGGMGQVWAAQDERMRREVAVKTVHPPYGLNEAETRARFQREVQLAGRLSHQNIVTVHDWGEVTVDGRQTLYLVMELLQGVSLHRRLKDATPGWPLAVGWAAQIVEALHAAHLRGVVHRDIKPANTLLTPDGTVKVLDFGVAKFLGDTLGARQLTVTGVPLGSPPYMSPEQAEGVRDIDHRSDLYSLGCLLYHAVTGRPPFVSHVQLAVLRMQMEDAPVPPSQLVPGLPSALDDLILHLLAKRPDDRPADAVAVHDVLTGILVQQAVSRSDVTVLDMARVRAADAVAGQLVKKAWEVWQQVEAVEVQIEETEAWAARVRTDAEAEIRRRLDEAAAAAEHTVAAARVEAERMVAAARSEASKILSEAKDTALQAESLRLDMWNDVHWPRQVMEALVPALLVTDDEKRAVTGYAFPAFAQVRRGYDRKQVEERIRQLLAERDDYQAELRSLARAYVTRKVTSGTTAGSSALEYEAVRRRAQQELIEALDTDLRYTDYEPRSAYASMGDGLPPFELVRKGYDRAQVDRYIEKLWQEEVYLYAGITVLRRLL